MVPTWKMVVTLMKGIEGCLPLGSSIEVKRDQSGRSELVSKRQCREENTVGPTLWKFVEEPKYPMEYSISLVSGRPRLEFLNM